MKKLRIIKGREKTSLKQDQKANNWRLITGDQQLETNDWRLMTGD